MAKSKYDTHVAPYLDKIAQWAEKGATQKEIAEKLQVATSTFKLYLSKGEKGEEPYSDLSACFAQACVAPDDEVEASMYKLCLGYNARVAKTFKVKEAIFDEDTGRKVREVEKLVTAFDEVHVPANVTAQMFWLANRRSTKWKYKPQENDGDDNSSETGVIMLPEVIANG